MVAPIFATTILVATLFTIVVPWVKEIRQKRNDLEENKATLNEKILPKLAILETQDPLTAKNYLLTMELLVPSSPNAPAIFNVLESLANNLGLKTESLVYSGTLQTDNKKEVEISFSVSGGQQPLLDFTNRLSSLSPLLQVTKLSATNQEGGENSTAVIKISSPSLRLPVNLGDIDQPVQAIGEREKVTLDTLVSNFLVPLTSSNNNNQITPAPLPFGKENPF